MRLRRYEIEDDVLRMQFIQGSEHSAYTVIENGIPETAKIFKIEYNPSRRVVEFWFEDESFVEVDGTPIMYQSKNA